MRSRAQGWLHGHIKGRVQRTQWCQTSPTKLEQTGALDPVALRASMGARVALSARVSGDVVEMSLIGKDRRKKRGQGATREGRIAVRAEAELLERATGCGKRGDGSETLSRELCPPWASACKANESKVPCPLFPYPIPIPINALARWPNPAEPSMLSVAVPKYRVQIPFPVLPCLCSGIERQT